jgi:sugar lactone lactonase YvrE
MNSKRWRWRIVGCAVVLIGACSSGEKREGSGAAGGTPTKTATVSGFQTPESVLWDSTLDVYFVSNINGNPTAKDRNGFISVVDPAGTMRDSTFIKGLNAPKGMAVIGDTLWVTDIDVIRGFNTRTQAPVATVAIPGSVFLNDITAAPDGSLYITDTAIRFGAQGPEHVGIDRIYRVASDRKVSIALESDSLGRPNGITYDRANDRFVVVPFGAGKFFGWKPDQAPTTLATGTGQFDGVEVVGDAIWVSSWADSSVYRYADGQGTNVIKGVASPADIGYDAKRKRVLIPLFMGNTVEIWQVN